MTSTVSVNPAHLIPAKPFTAGLDLRPTSRWPTKLADSTIDTVSAWPAAVAAPPRPREPFHGAAPSVSIIILTPDNLTFTTLCLQSIVSQSGLSGGARQHPRDE